jgi:hypothetical protein
MVRRAAILLAHGLDTPYPRQLCGRSFKRRGRAPALRLKA